MFLYAHNALLCARSGHLQNDRVIQVTSSRYSWIYFVVNLDGLTVDSSTLIIPLVSTVIHLDSITVVMFGSSTHVSHHSTVRYLLWLSSYYSLIDSSAQQLVDWNVCRIIGILLHPLRVNRPPLSWLYTTIQGCFTYTHPLPQLVCSGSVCLCRFPLLYPFISCTLFYTTYTWISVSSVYTLSTHFSLNIYSQFRNPSSSFTRISSHLSTFTKELFRDQECSSHFITFHTTFHYISLNTYSQYQEFHHHISSHFITFHHIYQFH